MEKVRLLRYHRLHFAPLQDVDDLLPAIPVTGVNGKRQA